MRPNFIGKIVQKNCTLSHNHDFKTRDKVLTFAFFSTVTVPVWRVTTSQLWHHRPQDPKDGLLRFQTEECDAELGRSNMSHKCIPHLSWSEECWLNQFII